MILIVDDDVAVAGVVAEVLREAGYAATIVRDGVDAVRLLKTEAVELLIVDLLLPMMDGMNLAQRVRANPQTQHLPLLLVSAWAAPLPHGQALFDAFVPKPFDLDQLLHAVQTLLARAAA